MTTSVNATNFRRFDFFKNSRVSPGQNSINAGDLVYDAGSGVAKALDSDANVANLLGVSEDTTPISTYGTEYLDTITVDHVGVFMMNTTSGDTYNPNQVVYWGGDAQTITNTKGSNNNAIGIIANDKSISNLAGGAGVQVPVKIFITQTKED